MQRPGRAEGINAQINPLLLRRLCLRIGILYACVLSPKFELPFDKLEIDFFLARVSGETVASWKGSCYSVLNISLIISPAKILEK